MFFCTERPELSAFWTLFWFPFFAFLVGSAGVNTSHFVYFKFNSVYFIFVSNTAIFSCYFYRPKHVKPKLLKNLTLILLSKVQKPEMLFELLNWGFFWFLTLLLS